MAVVAVGYDTAPTGGCCPAEAAAAGAAPAASRLCPLPRPHGQHGAAGAAQPGLPGAAVPCHQVGHTPLPGSPAPPRRGRCWPFTADRALRGSVAVAAPGGGKRAPCCDKGFDGSVEHCAAPGAPCHRGRRHPLWAGVRVQAAASSAWSSMWWAAGAVVSLPALAHGSPSPEAFTCVDTRRAPTWQPWCCPRTGQNTGLCRTSKVALLCPESGLPLGRGRAGAIEPRGMSCCS